MSATSTFRKVRHELRKRGIDLDWLLPLFVLAAGVLAGLLVWIGLSAWYLDYRAEVELKVGPEDRAEDAARSLVDRVGDREFQDKWYAAVRSHDGLCDHGELLVSLAGPDEGDVRLVRLVCHGRPRGAARLALARARDALADARASGISPLPPSNHAKRVADADRSVAEAKKTVSQIEAQVQSLRNAHAKAAEGKKQAQAAVDAVRKQLAGTDEKVLTARRRSLVDQRAKLATPADGSGALTEAEQQKLRDDYLRLERLLREDSRRDSTADHPIVRRMTEISRRLRLADLDRDVAEVDKKLALNKPLMDELAGALAALEKAADEETQVQKKLDDASGRLSQAEGEHSTRGVERKRLDSVAKIPVEVTAVGAISHAVEREWLVWPCLGGGLAAGLAGMILLRLRAMARHSHITSGSGLAHCLHVPVLGVVPDLGSIAPQQE